MWHEVVKSWVYVECWWMKLKSPAKKTYQIPASKMGFSPTIQGWDFFTPPKKVGVKQPQLTHWFDAHLKGSHSTPAPCLPFSVRGPRWKSHHSTDHGKSRKMPPRIYREWYSYTPEIGAPRTGGTYEGLGWPLFPVETMAGLGPLDSHDFSSSSC